ncbi:MAG: hypothetical protein V8R63_09590 [Thomasclavelia ramosa]
MSGAILAELTFLLTIVPVSMPDITESISALASNHAELNAFLQGLPSGYVIQQKILVRRECLLELSRLLSG